MDQEVQQAENLTDENKCLKIGEKFGEAIRNSSSCCQV